MMKPLLGVIGGMGVQATAWFYERLHSLQSVSGEQEYLDVLLFSLPSTPDRTAFITGQSKDSPLEPLIKAAKALESAGASCIAIPCVTSHFFYDVLAKSVHIPILNILDETARFIIKHGFKKVCLLATDGTLKGGAFHCVFEVNGISAGVPPVDSQADLMDLIYELKRGGDVAPDTLDLLIADALRGGAEAVVLGCTELCVIARDKTREDPGVVNTLEVLAGAALKMCSSSGYLS